MAEQLQVVISGDARQLIATLKEAGFEVDTFGKSGKEAAGGARNLNDASNMLRQTMGALGIGLGVHEVMQFTAESQAMARELGSARKALTATLGSADAYTAAIDDARASTQNMVGEAGLASNINLLLGMHLAKNTQEATQLARAASILSANYSAVGGTAEKYFMLLSGGSPMLYNNFAMTAQMVQAKQREIEKTQGLTGEEAKLAAIRALTIERANQLAGSMDQSSVQTAQLSAATDDFKAAWGALINDMVTGSGMIERTVGVLNDLRGALDEARETMADSRAESVANFATYAEYKQAMDRQRNSLQMTEAAFYKLKQAQEANRGYLDETARGIQRVGVYAGKTADDLKAAALGLSSFQKAHDKFMLSLRPQEAYGTSAEMYYKQQLAGGTTEMQTQIARQAWQEQYDTQQELTRKQEQADKQTAEERKQTMRGIADALKTSISDALNPTDVTQSDVLDTAMGKYADKWDEWARKMRDVANRGAISAWAGWANIPDEVKAGGEKAVKEWADDQVQAFYSGLRPEAVDWDAFVQGYQAQLEAAAGRAKMEDTARQKIEEAMGTGAVDPELFKQAYAEAFGGDPTLSPMMQKLLGGTPDAFKGALGSTMGSILSDPALFQPAGGGEGEEGKGGGLAGGLAGKLASDMPGAIDASGAGATLIDAMKTSIARADKDMLLLAKTFAAGFESALPSALKTTGTVFVEAVAQAVAVKLGLKVAGGARP
jgi:hypothetical protein